MIRPSGHGYPEISSNRGAVKASTLDTRKVQTLESSLSLPLGPSETRTEGIRLSSIRQGQPREHRRDSSPSVRCSRYCGLVEFEIRHGNHSAMSTASRLADLSPADRPSRKTINLSWCVEGCHRIETSRAQLCSAVFRSGPRLSGAVVWRFPNLKMMCGALVNLAGIRIVALEMFQ